MRLHHPPPPPFFLGGLLDVLKAPCYMHVGSSPCHLPLPLRRRSHALACTHPVLAAQPSGRLVGDEGGPLPCPSLPQHPCGSNDLIQTISRRSSEILSEENSGDKILTHLDTTPLMRLHHRHHTHLSSHTRTPRRAVLTSPSPVCRFCPLTLTVSHALSLYPR